MKNDMNRFQCAVGVLSVLLIMILASCSDKLPEGQTLPTESPTVLSPTAAVGTPQPNATSTIPADIEIYLGQPVPETRPEIFLPGLISTEGIELFFALHPNLKEAYFTRVVGGRSVIMVTIFDGTDWSEPVPASFGSDFQDVGPFITVDGKELYFWSNRPLTPTTPLMSNHQIWVVEREGNGWGEPRNLVIPIESIDGEWDVSVTADGRIYYMANYPSLGGRGLYRTQEVDGEFEMPEKVEALSNEEGLIELEPVISPDEQFMVFYSVGREDNLTPEGRVGDLYISFLQPSGGWSFPQNLGEQVNSVAEESTPSLSPDGRFLFFASNRDAGTNFPDIYWVSLEVIADLLE